MHINEESFRIGCGRYLQGKGFISKCAEEVQRVGTSPLFIGDDISIPLTKDKIIGSFGGSCKKYEFIVNSENCSDERASELALYAKKNGYDVIVGVGGGVIMDTAKLTAIFAGLPVINVPTSSATCAAYTPLSVRYTPEGRTVGSMYFKREVNAVIADTEIIGAEPVRLLLSGVFDALAKFVEIKQRIRENGGVYPLGLDCAYVLAGHTYSLLIEKTGKCIADMRRGVISDDVENVIFAAIAATGVISGIARGGNQSAVAHQFYETTRYLFPAETKARLHGEIVGVGLIMQNHFNGEEKENEVLFALMKEHGLPCCVSDIGVPHTEEVFREYLRLIKDSTAVNDKDEAECERFERSLRYLWDLG